uniref:glucuronosyltransferase n=1 Tax=Globodera rostochiensis TaxID=31243 RepID=A0A914HZB1_GLORO
MLFRHAFYCFFWPTLLFSALSGFELALFANNGCYSHDVMLREVGETFEAMLRSGSIRNGRGDTATAALSAGSTVTSPKTRHRIHWFQMFMYDFGFGGQLRRPSHWNSVVMETSKTDDSRPFMERGSRLLWEVTVPFDHNRPWNLRGALFLFELIWRNQQNCEHFVKSAEFRIFLSRNHVDLVTFIFQFRECLTVAASLLNSSATIQFSNWPIADGYIASLNIPAPPSAYPKTSTPFSAREMHSFFVRLRNSLFHALIAFVRRLQRRMVARFFASVGLFHRRGVRLEQTEAAHLFYAGRAEFIAEPVRPISNRIKHFGCANCLNEAQINQCQESESGEKIVPIMCWPIPSLNISSRERCEQKGTSKTQKKGNYSKTVGTNSAGQMVELSQQLIVSSRIRQQFPLIDWSETERRRFVLVSFGSIAKVEFMPEALFRSVLRAFSNFPSLLFVWQTNSEPNAIMEGKRCQKLPKNVRIVRWAPIKILLAHPNLHYAILHGGVNTVNEALIYGGKPILGLPLQGDQPSNLQRLVDLGMATQVDIGQVWRGQLHVKMALMEKNYAEYSRRAKQITAMIRTYRMGIGAGQQNFWLRWVANKPFLKRSAHTFFRLTYRSSIEHFALAELGTALTFFRPIEDSEPFREVLLVDENDSSDDGAIAEETVVVENFDPFRQQYGAVFGDNQREVEEMWSDEEEEKEGEEEGKEKEEEEKEEREKEEEKGEEEKEEGKDGSTSTKEELVQVEAQSEEEEKGEDDGKCAKGWLNFQDKVCFYGLRSQRQFNAGVEECGHLRANFTSIHSVEEYKFINSHWNLRNFWIGIFNGKSHYEDGTPVDPEVFRQISPLIPWSTPDVLKGFICRKNPIIGDEPEGGSSEEMGTTKDDEALEERVRDEQSLETIRGDGDKAIVDDGNNPTISETLIESNRTTSSETLIELNKTTNSETMIELNNPTSSETLIESNKTTNSETLIESNRTTNSETLIELNNPTSSETLIELNKTTNSETMIELNKTTSSETLIESNRTTNSETSIELNNPTSSETLIELNKTTNSETMIELNNPTSSETLIELNKTTNSETLIEPNKRPISKTLIVAELLIVDEDPRSPAGTSSASSPFPSLIAHTLLCFFFLSSFALIS